MNRWIDMISFSTSFYVKIHSKSHPICSNHAPHRQSQIKTQPCHSSLFSQPHESRTIHVSFLGHCYFPRTHLRALTAQQILVRHVNYHPTWKHKYASYMTYHGCSSGTKTVLSNVLSQVCSSSTLRTMNVHRLLFEFFIGSLITAPLYHFFYDTLEIHWTIKKWIYISLNLFLDQLHTAPLCTVGYFSLFTSFYGHLKSSTLLGRLHEDFVTMSSMWLIYPLAQALNLSFVPAIYTHLVCSLLS